MEGLTNDDIKMMLGRILQNQIGLNGSIHDHEFRVFSQFGDDGFIQFLIQKVKPLVPYFIEFGVEDYLESNTRFLLQNNNWSGFVMDGSEANIDKIKRHHFFWRHDLKAVKAFVNAENINGLLESNILRKDVGLLHIDIDGNDYWIWKAIDCISPAIVIVEYNSVFGSERAITVPYYPDFQRTKHHFSNLYAGCSLAALCDLADEKGYYFVGSNSAGNNAYFVRKELIGDLKILSAGEGYVESKFRESRDEKGNLTFLRAQERLQIIKGMKVFNTRSQQLENL